VSLGRQPPNSGTHAAGRGHLALARQLDASQTRSMTAAMACPKPMHIVAIP
jgi:hypothetical protein